MQILALIDDVASFILKMLTSLLKLFYMLWPLWLVLGIKYLYKNIKAIGKRKKTDQKRSYNHEPDITLEQERVWHDEYIKQRENLDNQDSIEYQKNTLQQENIELNKDNPQKNINEDIDFQNSYEARYLLTKNEWQQYHTLKKAADIKGYIVCPKVRLLDIIQPRRGAPKYKTLFYKIQSKHVDFVICGPDLRIRAVIEIDDNSHEIEDRKKRDEFVDMILRSVGYKVIHTKYINVDILDTV